MADSVIIKGVRDGEPVDVLIDAQGRLQIVATSISGSVSILGTVPVVGNVAHDDPDSGAPIKHGGKASSGNPTPVADGDRVNARYSTRGHIIATIGDSAGLLADTFAISAGRALGVFIDAESNLGSVAIVGLADVVGPIAHGGSGSGDPVPIGGQAETTSPTAVSDGQTVRARFDELGCFGVRIFGRTTGGTEVPWTFNNVGGFGLPNMTVADPTAGTPAAVVTLADNALNTNGLVVRADNSEFDGTTWDRVRHSFKQTTTGIVANGAGATLDMTMCPMSKFAIMVDRTAGAAAWTVNLEGSIDGTNWSTLVAASATDGALAWVVDRPVDRIRYNVVTVGASNTLTIVILACAR